MNTGIEILLQRLKDCPDDFQYNLNTDTSTKWNKLLMEALRSDVITDEEKTALRHEVTEMGRARFTENVMKALAGEGEPSDEGKSLRHPIQGTGLGGLTQGQFTLTPNTMATGTVTLPSGSITLGGTTLSEAGLKQMLATHKAMREETKPKRWWNKSLPELLGKK